MRSIHNGSETQGFSGRSSRVESITRDSLRLDPKFVARSVHTSKIDNSLQFVFVLLGQIVNQSHAGISYRRCSYANVACAGYILYG